MVFWRSIFLIVGIFIFGLFFIRLILPSQLDDVSPEISCEDKLLDWADVYYIIPKFNNTTIETEWRNSILMKNKELAMHGVSHTYNEFGKVRDKEYFTEGVDIFIKCFGFSPENFKPGQLKWNDGNDWIKNEINVDLFWNQFFHKVYHCGDTGVFPNWFIRIF